MVGTFKSDNECNSISSFGNLRGLLLPVPPLATPMLGGFRTTADTIYPSFKLRHQMALHYATRITTEVIFSFSNIFNKIVKSPNFYYIKPAINYLNHENNTRHRLWEFHFSIPNKQKLSLMENSKSLLSNNFPQTTTSSELLSKNPFPITLANAAAYICVDQTFSIELPTKCDMISKKTSAL